MSEPIADLVNLLIGNTGDYHHLGPWKYVSVAFYLLLLLAGFMIAGREWRQDPNQRTIRDLSIFAMRVTAAGMWFQGTIWKLPLPVSDGFAYWLGQEGRYSAIPLYAALVKSVLAPHIALLQTPVYLLEIAFTVSLTLGLAVRLCGVVAVLFTLQLWIGLYNDPTEWPWTYAAIIFTHGMFAAAAAGRSLGLDAFFRRHVPAVLRGDSRIDWFYHLSS